MQIGAKQSAGQFSYYTDGSRSNPVSYIFAKDLDGDGSQEVLFVAFETQPNTPAAYSNTSVHIFGWKNSTFQDLTSQWLPNNSNLVEGVGDVAFGDFNGDGLVDIFLSAYTDMNHPVNAYELINRGGTLEKVSLGLETWMHAVASADINRDGFDDVISAGYSTGVHQFLGSASGLTGYQGMVGSSGLALGDFLGDGTVTAIFVDAGSGSQDTFLYRFDINQQNNIIGLQKISTLPGPRLATLGLETATASSHDIRARPMDFNSDGLLDVVVFSYLANYTSGLSPNEHKSEIQFLLNCGGGQFQDVTNQYRIGYDTTGYVGYYPQVGDFNLDGRLDIFTSQPDWFPSYNSTTLLLQQQDGTYLDTDRALIRNNITSVGAAQEILVSGPNQSKYLVSESAWSWSDPVTKIYIQELSFPERELDELLMGTNISDVIYGLGGNDAITGKAGNDSINGGEGIDTAVYSGALREYGGTIASRTIIDLVANRDGTDTLAHIERLAFTDTMLALDTQANENAGNSYLLYQAAFDRTPDVEGLGYWISKMDQGANIVTDVAQNFILSNEFKGMYGTNPTATEFTNLLYQNVLHRLPDAEGLNYWLSEFARDGDSLYKRAGTLNNFAISAENIANVADQIVDGIQYQAYVG